MDCQVLTRSDVRLSQFLFWFRYCVC